MSPAESPSQLHEKMRKIQAKIKEWTKDKIENIKEQILVCRDYISWIGKVQEQRTITQLEKWVWTLVKRRYVELSVMEEII